MSSLAERPRVAAPLEPEVLFKEARRRRRRRRIGGAVALLGLVAGLLTTLAIRESSGSSPREGSALRQIPVPAAPLGPPRIAWVDYAGGLHVGDLTSGRQRTVAQAGADPTTPLIAVGSRIFWTVLSPTGRQVPVGAVFSYDTATGRTRLVAAGLQVFPTADRSALYVESNDTRMVTEYALDGGARASLRLPSGWFLSDPSLAGDPTPVIAGGFLVQSARQQLGNAPPTLAIWYPKSGEVRRLGSVWKVIGTYTSPGARSSLIAWAPGECELGPDCALRVTETSTMRSHTYRNPLGFGFDWGGGFSPDGRELAVFPQSNSGDVNPATRLALIDLPSETLHLVTGVDIQIGESLAWAQWLPGGGRLIVGGQSDPFGTSGGANHYLVDSATGHARTFRFLPHRNLDVNYSAVVVQ